MRLATRIAVSIVLLVASQSGAFAFPGDPQARIRALRGQARYQEAAVLADSTAKAVGRSSQVRPHQIDDARREADFLSFVAALPENDQQQLAYYDRFQAEIETRFQRFLRGDSTAVSFFQDLDGDLKIRQRYVGRDPLACMKVLALSAFIAWKYSFTMVDTSTNPFVLANEPPIRLLEEAVRVADEYLGEDHPATANALTSLAIYIQREDQDWERAAALSRRALRIQRVAWGDDSDPTLNATETLGRLLMDQGRYAEAKPLLQMAVSGRVQHSKPSPERRAASLSTLATLYGRQRDFGRAIPLLREAASIEKEKNGAQSVEYLRSLGALASIMVNAGEYNEVEKFAFEALAVLKEMRRSIEGSKGPHGMDEYERIVCMTQATASIVVCQARALDLRNREGSEGVYDLAERMVRGFSGPDDYQLVPILSGRASRLFEKGEYEEARTQMVRAKDIILSRRRSSHPEAVAALTNLGILELLTGDLDEAQQHLSQAARDFEISRATGGVGYERATFLESPYRALAWAKLRRDSSVSAWEAVERDQARALFDLMAAAAEERLSDEERLRRGQLLSNMTRATKLLEGASRDDSGETHLARARSQLMATEAEWLQFQNEMDSAHGVSAVPLSLTEAETTLSDDEAIVGWLDSHLEGLKGSGWAFVIRRTDGVRWFALGADSASGGLDPYADSQEYRLMLSDYGSSASAISYQARKMWRGRMKPLEPALQGVKTLIVVPSGPMLGVPIETLADDDGTLLVARYTIEYAPSASVRAYLRRKAGRSGRGETRVLALGDPSFTDGGGGPEAGTPVDSVTVALLRRAATGNELALASLPPLPSTRTEANAVSRFADEATVLLGRDASEQALDSLADEDKLRDFSIIHLATHALVDDEQPGRSALVLSQIDLPNAYEAAVAGEPVYDGLLTADEIARRWELDADLVTLSACETGLGKEIGGEGYIGLAYAFLQAGARNTIVSLWRVDDRATSLLMQRFYEDFLTDHMPLGEALGEAKQWLRSYKEADGTQPYRHPFFWSAFIIIGSGS